MELGGFQVEDHSDLHCGMEDTATVEFDWQSGYCHVFAIALSDILGYKLIGIQVDYADEDALFRYLPQGHVIEHVYAVAPDGQYVDSKEKTSPKEIIRGYRALGMRVRLRSLTRKQIMRMSGNNLDDNFYEFDLGAYRKAIEAIESALEKYKDHGGRIA